MTQNVACLGMVRVIQVLMSKTAIKKEKVKYCRKCKVHINMHIKDVE